MKKAKPAEAWMLYFEFPIQKKKNVVKYEYTLLVSWQRRPVFRMGYHTVPHYLLLRL